MADGKSPARKWRHRLLEGTVGARLLEGSGVVELYLPYEFTSVLIVTSNTDPFGIDPEQTTLIP